MKKLLLLFFLVFSLIPVFGQDSQYQLGPESKKQEGVPTGTVTRFLFESKLYNNFRYYYLYVPAQYDPSKPTALMIFQDGYAYIREDGDFRAGIVFDNLIAKKQMPVTIGLFINPGHATKDFPEIFFRSSNRSDEYDELSDRYTNFLLNELIPEVKKQYNISDDRKMHAIGGMSSGGICAFTAAWQRPDYFSKVMSHIGSFTDIKGGHEYPNIIRKGSKKDIKIFLQDGNGDLDNIHGNWWLANLEIEASLKFKDYEYKFEKGTGSHSGKHGGAILPESLVWLWGQNQSSGVKNGK
ncbi:MAG TPA: alpha/beta hydrolase-fold protein [Pyrinomonadaceae bacterium]|nr:alpha/beta hydrolase-fold protein [Pyrinomonadaceae bacterium]